MEVVLNKINIITITNVSKNFISYKGLKICSCLIFLYHLLYFYNCKIDVKIDLKVNIKISFTMIPRVFITSMNLNFLIY